MSAPHPTISAWERTHDGPYEAELHDWKLVVSWTPNTSTTRGAFVWTATRDEATANCEHSFEEMEHAMADAEHFAAEDAARRTHEINALSTGH